MANEVENARVQGAKRVDGKPVVQLGKAKGQKKPLPRKKRDPVHDSKGRDDQPVPDPVDGGVRDADASAPVGGGGESQNIQGALVNATQVQYQFRCKICQLSRSHSDLYDELHEQVINKAMKLTGAMALVNERLKDTKDFQPLNMANLSVHFNKHVPVRQKIAYEVSRQRSAETTALMEAPATVTAMVAARVGTEVDDFKDLADLRERLRSKLDTIERTIEQVDEQGHTVLNKLSLQVYTETIKEVRACVESLNKMRQSERLTSVVIKALLDRMTFNIVPQLLEEYKLVTTALTDKGVEPGIVMMVDQRLRLRTAQIIAETARAAVIEVSREFKI